jgi:hypothetical protein
MNKEDSSVSLSSICGTNPYGGVMDLYTKPITQNYSHKKISGGHKREAVLLLYSYNGNIKNIERPATVEGIKDYILQILDR